MNYTGDAAASGFFTISLKDSNGDRIKDDGSVFYNDLWIDFVAADDAVRSNVKSVELLYSTNYGYFFNNLIGDPISLNQVTGAAEVTYRASFHNCSLGGAILYILKTPLNATVPTYNAINQGYNVVALSYNTNQIHNSIVQMCSSMEVTCNDLSGLRLEIVNDQYEHVKIRNPVYIQFTVSNE